MGFKVSIIEFNSTIQRHNPSKSSPNHCDTSKTDQNVPFIRVLMKNANTSVGVLQCVGVDGFLSSFGSVAMTCR